MKRRIEIIIAALIMAVNCMAQGDDYYYTMGQYVAPVTYAHIGTANSNITLSGGNLTAVVTNSATGTCYSNIGVSSASTYPKIMWEVKLNSYTTLFNLGICQSTATLTNDLANDVHASAWDNYGSGTWYNNAVNAYTYFGGGATAVWYLIALDMTAGKIYVYDPTVPGYLMSGNPSTGANSFTSGITGTWYPAFGFYSNGNITVNFGPVSSFHNSSIASTLTGLGYVGLH